ncbi:hypothetical protein N7523_002297 [Penicillium sp. IBT 18751x]|nr:hypothetical protein N7523_002297 [Penicillium sp. IBT 18751x]
MPPVHNAPVPFVTGADRKGKTGSPPRPLDASHAWGRWDRDGFSEEAVPDIRCSARRELLKLAILLERLEMRRSADQARGGLELMGLVTDQFKS